MNKPPNIGMTDEWNVETADTIEPSILRKSGRYKKHLYKSGPEGVLEDLCAGIMYKLSQGAQETVC